VTMVWRSLVVVVLFCDGGGGLECESVQSGRWTGVFSCGRASFRRTRGQANLFCREETSIRNADAFMGLFILGFLFGGFFFILLGGGWVEIGWVVSPSGIVLPRFSSLRFILTTPSSYFRFTSYFLFLWHILVLPSSPYSILFI